MCFAAVIKVHQSLGWGKIQTGGQRKKSWVQIVDLPRVIWSQILFALHCLTEALSKKYTQAKFIACINKLNVTEVSCLHQQWICLPAFKWFLHPLMSEQKTTFITGSKLTNYTSFLFLTVEVGEKVPCSTEEPPALVCITWIWHREVLCGAAQGEMDIKGRGSLPKCKEIPLARPTGGQTGEYERAVRLQQVRWGSVFIPSLLTGSDLRPLSAASHHLCTCYSP